MLAITVPMMMMPTDSRGLVMALSLDRMADLRPLQNDKSHLITGAALVLWIVEAGQAQRSMVK
jgi:hypothetical protein